MRDITKALHAGYGTDPTTKSSVPPIAQTVAYEFDSASHGAALFNLEEPGNIYSRIMNRWLMELNIILKSNGARDDLP